MLSGKADALQTTVTHLIMIAVSIAFLINLHFTSPAGAPVHFHTCTRPDHRVPLPAIVHGTPKDSTTGCTRDGGMALRQASTTCPAVGLQAAPPRPTPPLAMPTACHADHPSSPLHPARTLRKAPRVPASHVMEHFRPVCPHTCCYQSLPAYREVRREGEASLRSRSSAAQRQVQNQLRAETGACFASWLRLGRWDVAGAGRRTAARYNKIVAAYLQSRVPLCRATPQARPVPRHAR